MRYKNKDKIILRNNTDTVIANTECSIYYLDTDYNQTIDTKFAYKFIKPHETITLKISKFPIERLSRSPLKDTHQVKFVLHGYSYYDDYSRIY